MPPPPPPSRCCTSAITGSTYPAHQAIFVCDTCRVVVGGIGGVTTPPNDDDDPAVLPSCVCRSCAIVCHADHDVYLVGFGPCTCDCARMTITTTATATATTTDDDDDAIMIDDDDVPEEEDDVDIGERRGRGGGGNRGCRLAESSLVEARKLGYASPTSLDDATTTTTSSRLLLFARDAAEGEGMSSYPPVARWANNDDDNNDDDGDDIIDVPDYSACCIPCRTYVGGYDCEAYTLSNLATTTGTVGAENDIVRASLIGQALALADRSKDTFWLSGDDGHNDNEVGLCDLEILAGNIYRHHVGSRGIVGSGGGAEWWVQVKPAGSTSASPVDLHYDKDENLAETFGLGSFPELSTVTYLTDGDDNASTIIFPRRYVDPEDVTMDEMLLCHPVAGKHLAFDGRLLHGAPAHPSLLRRNRHPRRGKDESDDDDHHREGEDDGGGDGVVSSSLRVTFLVNVWTTRRPSGVNVLPDWIRDDLLSVSRTSTTTEGVGGGVVVVRSSSPLRNSLPLSFVKRKVSEISISADDVGWTLVGGGGATHGEGMIVLPFVSEGATWMGDDDDDDGADDVEMDASEDAQDEDDDAGDEEEEEEEEEDGEDDDDLFLLLSPFATAEYMDDEADTFIFSYVGGNGARLVRGLELDAMKGNGHPREKAAADNDEEVHGADRVTMATQFLSDLRERVPSFVSSIAAHLDSRYGMDVTGYVADHVCYRTESVEEYSCLVEALRADRVNFLLLVESVIGGRPIATFKLTKPIEVGFQDGSTRQIDVVEIPSPKYSSPYPAGLEHVEFVVGDGPQESPVNSDAHRAALTSWMEMHPSVSWNTKALGKRCNPDVSTKLELPDHGRVSIKFHLMPLEDVIKFEGSV